MSSSTDKSPEDDFRTLLIAFPATCFEKPNNISADNASLALLLFAANNVSVGSISV